YTTKYIVLGDSGFVGKNLTKCIENNNKSVTLGINRSGTSNSQYEVVQIDISKNTFSHVLNKYCDRYTEIVLCAANPLVKSGIDNYIQNHNILINTLKSIFDYIQGIDYPHVKFTYISSMSVYGNKLNNQQKNVGWYDVELSSMYAQEKYNAENLIERFFEQWEDERIFNFRVIRPCAMVGPYLTHGLVYDILRKLASISPTIDLLGYCPGSRKPYLHVQSLCELIVNYPNGFNNRKYNISAADNASVLEIASVVMQETVNYKPI